MMQDLLQRLWNAVRHLSRRRWSVKENGGKPPLVRGERGVTQFDLNRILLSAFGEKVADSPRKGVMRVKENHCITQGGVVAFDGGPPHPFFFAGGRLGRDLGIGDGEEAKPGGSGPCRDDVPFVATTLRGVAPDGAAGGQVGSA
ncbi:MAG: hypothetical protein NT069_29115 [Planctomycetota bacterium]|nr:hypothetical protein [Planctomycetota bacterium]